MPEVIKQHPMSPTTELANLSVTILASVGGSAAIIIGLSTWLGKVWADRILIKEKQKYAKDLATFKSDLTQTAESYKLKLKKSEILFAKEVDAMSALVSLLRDISPRASRPEMDWYDACDEMACAFEATEERLQAYLREHGAILPDDVRHLICMSLGFASSFKFGDSSPEVLAAANDAALKMFNGLTAAESRMTNQVRSQVAN